MASEHLEYSFMSCTLEQDRYLMVIVCFLIGKEQRVQKNNQRKSYKWRYKNRYQGHELRIHSHNLIEFIILGKSCP